MTISDVENRRNTLIREASRLFREKGYHRTTVRDIARAVGLQSGSIFYHFRNKEEILQAVMADGTRRMREEAERCLADLTEPAQRLEALIHAHLRVLLGETKDDMVVLLYEWRNLPDELRRPLVEMRNTYEQVWDGVLTDALSTGLVRGEASLLRRITLGALNWTVQWYRHDGPLTPDDLADEIYAMLTHQPPTGRFAGDEKSAAPPGDVYSPASSD